MLKMGVTPTPAGFDDMVKLLDSLGAGYKYTSFNPRRPAIPREDQGLFRHFPHLLRSPAELVSEFAGSGRPARHQERRGRPEDVLDRGIARSAIGSNGAARSICLGLAIHVGPGRLQRICRRRRKHHGGDARFRRRRDRRRPPQIKLGEQRIHLSFNMPGWYPAAFNKDKVTTYLRGKYRSQEDGQMRTTPRCWSNSPCGKGTVIFTSFHNESQNSENRDQASQVSGLHDDHRSIRQAGRSGFFAGEEGTLQFVPRQPNVFAPLSPRGSRQAQRRLELCESRQARRSGSRSSRRTASHGTRSLRGTGSSRFPTPSPAIGRSAWRRSRCP